MYQPRERLVHSSLEESLVNNHLIILQWDHCCGQENFHEEHNDTHSDLPSTFRLDEFAFKSHSSAHICPLRKFKVNTKGRFTPWTIKSDHGMTMQQKVNVLIFVIYSPKGQFRKKLTSSLTILLFSFVFIFSPPNKIHEKFM